MMRISSLSQRRSKDVVIGLHMQRDATRTCIEGRPRNCIMVEKRDRALCVSKLHGNSTMKYTCGGGAYQLDFGIHPKARRPAHGISSAAAARLRHSMCNLLNTFSESIWMPPRITDPRM
jgi:hypothetical protein